MNGWRNPVVVPMVNVQTGRVDFEVTLWGTTIDEAMCVPCEAIHSLAARYPNHASSPFLLREAFPS